MPESPASPVLVAEGVVAGYIEDVDILNGVDLELADGELVGIIGPNGAGKSTLIKALFGLLRIRSGSIRLGEDEITNTRPHDLVARGIGYVPQRANVFASLTVRENLEMGVYQQPRRFHESYGIVSELFP